MAKGYAFLAGLTGVNASKYGGWNGENGCWGCELDVDNVARIVAPMGYEIQMRKTGAATRTAILDGLAGLAGSAGPGDIALFYFSGHGGQQPDKDGDELDGMDETLIAFDGPVIDDEVHRALKSFKAGVRVLMLSDSCNSGTNYKGLFNVPKPTPFRPFSDEPAEISAMLIHLGGCRDGFTSSGYRGGGAFTVALCNAWDGGKFRGSLRALHETVAATLKAQGETQDTTYTEYGVVNGVFRDQPAFSVGR